MSLCSLTSFAMASLLATQLPTELVCLIIQHTDDHRTLRDWCRATKGNSALYRCALAARWTKVQICQNDFIPPLQYRKDNGSMRRGLLRSLIQPLRWHDRVMQDRHPVAASYVKHLTLNFHFRSAPQAIVDRLTAEVDVEFDSDRPDEALARCFPMWRISNSRWTSFCTTRGT